MTYEELAQKYIQIPQEIKEIRRWICYNIETNDKGEETKVPINALTGTYASTSNHLTWTSFKLALGGCVKYNCAGLGFILGTDDATGETYFGVDLDNHVDKVTGKKPFASADDFEEFASIFINQLNSYTEYSHSLEGVHIICKGKLPEGARKTKGVEMYDWRRFFTMTGKIINNVPIADRTEEVKPLWEKYVNVKKEEFSASYSSARPTQVQAVVDSKGAVTFEEVEVVEICGCPKCSGKIVEKKSKRGKVFYGCNNYPKCKTAYWDQPVDRACPLCEEMLVTKNNVIKCSACEYQEG
mgnify:CR=1 FL=1